MTIMDIPKHSAYGVTSSALDIERFRERNPYAVRIGSWGSDWNMGSGDIEIRFGGDANYLSGAVVNMCSGNTGHAGQPVHMEIMTIDAQLTIDDLRRIRDEFSAMIAALDAEHTPSDAPQAP